MIIQIGKNGNSDWEKWLDEVREDIQYTKDLELSYQNVLKRYGLFFERISAKGIK